MKNALRRLISEVVLTVVFCLSAAIACAQAAPSSSVETVTLAQLVAAAKPAAPNLQLAVIALDSARSQLVQTQATTPRTRTPWDGELVPHASRRSRGTALGTARASVRPRGEATRLATLRAARSRWKSARCGEPLVG